MSKFQTIQRRHVTKHLPHISGVKVFTLDNNFSGQPFQGSIDDWAAWALNRMEDKLQVSKADGVGTVYLHGNCWYEFTYSAQEVSNA